MMNSQRPIASEDYNKFFDPNAYMDTFYSDINGADIGWKYFPNTLKFWHETFEKGDIEGDDLLDLGTGPNLMPAIIASRRFKNIYLSDYAEPNRRALLAWMKRESGTWNWTPICQLIAKMEGLDDDERGAKIVENRVRAAIRDVYECDVRNDQPLHPRPPRQYDCLITAAVLESACPDRQAYSKSVRSLATLIKPGGKLVLVGHLNATFYTVGGEQFSALATDKDFVRTTFEEAGFERIEMNVCEEVSPIKTFDANGYFILKAQIRS